MRISINVRGIKANLLEKRGHLFLCLGFGSELVHLDRLSHGRPDGHARIERSVRVLEDDLHAATKRAELWFSSGGWVGLIAVYFIAGRVRKIAQYTVPDLLEQRYNAAARILGTVAIILAYVTIAAYQFRGGGWILTIVTDGAIDPTTGVLITALAIVTFTALAGMVSIVTVDVLNGIIITLAIALALPYLVFQLGVPLRRG